MNLDEVNDNILADLATQHRTYFMTYLLSERLDRASLTEVVLYAYGVLAGQEEIEEFREPRPVRDHEGYADCETSAHFWRGVCDVRGTIFVFENKKARKKTSRTGYHYPAFRVNGSQLLLGRLYDFFRWYSPYPQVANEKFLAQIDEERGHVHLTGMPAQMAVYNLYHQAHVGARMHCAAEILGWKPLAGSELGGVWVKPVRPDLSKLKPIPDDIFG